MKKILALLFIPLFVGCGLFHEKVSMGDSRVQSLLRAAASFNRQAYGFTPIPDKADVRLESRHIASYDVMLHIDFKTSRTIAFKKAGTEYKWVGEQETFSGPKKYSTVDGTFNESISLTYDIEKVSGYPTNRLNISYFGEDPRLVGRNDLTLKEIQPILKEWNY